ncbi:hypothetical protein ACFSTC_44445 [Nonomuraea ferruginea]
MNLKKKAKGKNRLISRRQQGEHAYWTGRAKLGGSFKVAVDCVGPQGEVVIDGVEAFHFVRQCISGYTTYTVDRYPSGPLETHKVTVRASEGIKWAILVTHLP